MGQKPQRLGRPPLIEETSIQEDEIIEKITPPTQTPLYEVKITHPSLRRRAQPNEAAKILGVIEDQGIYKIFDIQNGWGKLDDGSWIMLCFTGKIK